LIQIRAPYLSILNPRSFFLGNFLPLFMDLLSAASAEIVPRFWSVLDPRNLFVLWLEAQLLSRKLLPPKFLFSRLFWWIA